MQKMMMKRMEKMSDTEKKEMMIKMMSTKGGSPCTDMMEKESGTVLNDSLSMVEKARVMLPLCFANILFTVDDEMKRQYLTDMTYKVIESNWSNRFIDFSRWLGEVGCKQDKR